MGNRAAGEEEEATGRRPTVVDLAVGGRKSEQLAVARNASSGCETREEEKRKKTKQSRGEDKASVGAVEGELGH